MGTEVAVISNPSSPPGGVLRPTLERMIRSAPTGPGLLGRIKDVEVTGGGQIVVLDQLERNLKLYGAEGELLRVIGRPGAGPGELSEGIDRVLYRPPGELIVPDLGHGRIQRFAVSGEDLGIIPLDLAEEGAPIAMAVHPDGRILEANRAVPGVTGVPGTDDATISLRARGTGKAEVLFTLNAEAGGRRAVARPELLAPQPVWAITPTGDLAVGDPASYRVRIADERGLTRRVFQRPFEPRPIDRSDSDLLHELFAGFLVRSGMPEPDAKMVARMSTRVAPEYPAFTRMLVDGADRIWVQRAASARELVKRGLQDFSFDRLGSHRWDVFDGEGRYMAVVEFPEKLWVTRVLDGTIVGFSEDAEGIPTVELYRLEGLSESLDVDVSS